MRLSLLFTSSLFVLLAACSSGGPGDPTIPGPPGGFGTGGSSTGVLGSGGGPTGGPSQNGGPDAGPTVTKDSGSNGPRDTGTSNTSDPICAKKCPADDTFASCNALINGTTCSAEYRAYFGCLQENGTCDATGKLDSTAYITCKDAATALGTCRGG
jgi:hypothetical protein